MDYNRRLAKAEGFSDGFEKGMEKGRREGIKEGMEKGREEAILQTARKLLELGIPIADVAKATGLSEEQINEKISSED